MDKLIFEIDKVEIIEDASDSQLSKLRLWIAKSGENRHKMPIDKEAIQLSKPSLVGKPILCAYNQKRQGFEGHDASEVPVGVFLKESDIFFEEIDGETWIVSDAYVWKFYFPHIMDVFKKQKGESAISMEIQILDYNEETHAIKLFAFLGVTLIGKTPAIPNAKAEVLEFSELVSKTEEILKGEFSDNNIEKEDEKPMVFNKQEYAEKYSLTANQMWDILYAACSQKKYQSGDDEYSKYWVRDYDDTYIFAYDNENGNTYALSYTFDGNTATVDFESAKRVRLTYVIIEENEQFEDDKDSNEKFAKHVLSKEIQTYESEKTEFETKITNLEAEKTNLTTQIETEKQNFETQKTTFEVEKTELSKQIQTLTDENTNLKEFKSNIETKEFEDSCMAELNKFKEVFEEKDFNEWSGKIKDFTAVVDFTNALKVFAFDKNVKFSSDEGYIALPKNGNNEKPKNVWDRI